MRQTEPCGTPISCKYIYTDGQQEQAGRVQKNGKEGMRTDLEDGNARKLALGQRFERFKKRGRSRWSRKVLPAADAKLALEAYGQWA